MHAHQASSALKDHIKRDLAHLAAIPKKRELNSLMTVLSVKQTISMTAMELLVAEHVDLLQLLKEKQRPAHVLEHSVNSSRVRDLASVSVATRPKMVKAVKTQSRIVKPFLSKLANQTKMSTQQVVASIKLSKDNCARSNALQVRET